jgi:hypothetical protein
MVAVGHDGDAVDATAAAVSATEDRRAVALLEEDARDVRDDRRFPGAANTEVANAHDRPRQRSTTLGSTVVPDPAPGGDRGVQGA